MVILSVLKLAPSGNAWVLPYMRISVKGQNFMWSGTARSVGPRTLGHDGDGWCRLVLFLCIEEVAGRSQI